MILKRKEFSNKEQKALRRKWEASLGKEEINKDDIDWMKDDMEFYKRGAKGKNAETEAAIKKARWKNNHGDILGPKTLEDKQHMSPAGLKRTRKSELEDFKHYKESGKNKVSMLNPEKEIPQLKMSEAVHKLGGANPNARGLGMFAGLNEGAKEENKKIREKLKRKEERERLLKEELEKQRQKAEKQRLQKASVAKHKSQAEKLREDHKVGVAVRDAKRWAKKNPGKAATGLALGTAAVASAGYGIKKAIDKKHPKNNDSEK